MQGCDSMGLKVESFIEHKLSGMQGLLKYRVSPMLVDKAKESTYWKDRTRNGHARNGINCQVEVKDKKYILPLAYDVEYGQWLEEGTGIYGPMHKPIVPINKKALSWVDEDGKKHFAMKVKGMKPTPIIRDTLENNKHNVANEIIRYWSE